MSKLMIQIIDSPIVVFIIYLFVGGLLLAAGKKIAAKGEKSKGKHMHYSCGEDLEVPSLNLNYHHFFRLALLFGILHIVALVLSTIPSKSEIRILPILYLVCAGISIFILLDRDKRR